MMINIRTQTLQNKNLAKPKQKPILLKIAPDLTDEQLLDIIDIVNETKIAGVIATNTTLSRDGLVSENKIEMGGLSGKPIMNKSTKLLNAIFMEDHTIPLIGVGGVMGYDDFIKKIDAGASLVQIYSGFIVKGPLIVKDILKN